MGHIYTTKSTLYLICLSFVWLLVPFLSVFLLLLLILQVHLSLIQYKYVFFMISLSFALLAYTQKSLSVEDTDVVRYYMTYEPLIGGPIKGSTYLVLKDMLYYFFMLTNICLVFLTSNVQVISLFWTFITYYLFFLTMLKLLHYQQIECSRINIFILTFLSLFGFILFTQVTETIKNAAAFAIFFYAFTCFICKENKVKVFLLYFIGVGVHISILMFIPLFFYKMVNYRFLFLLLLIAILLSSINLMELISNILPDKEFGSLLLERVEYYANEGKALFALRYISILVFVWLVSFFLFKNSLFNKENGFFNIVILYLIISCINYSNFDGFVRFVNFIQFILLLEFLPLLRNKKKNALLVMVFVMFFGVTNLLMTYSRTLSPIHDYRSSYMDNSVPKVLFSNVFDYLNYKAY